MIEELLDKIKLEVTHIWTEHKVIVIGVSALIVLLLVV
jgi:hypothetical protein|tara:strand:+ start:67 stop:180 length:114 start_codon:yes stop_codon:yes gene_type:complete